MMLLSIMLGPFYLFYLWSHRRRESLVFGTVFFVGETINFVLGLISRLLLWHRQRRHVCRLDALTPPFPRSQWPRVHIFFTHYMEPPADSVDPLRQAVQQDYPAESYVVTILDDGYHKRKGEAYETTEIGQAMVDMVAETLADLTPSGQAGITKTQHDVQPNTGSQYRHEVAPGGSTVIEFRVEGLPLVRLVGRKKGPDSYMKTGNLENALWNVMESDVPFMVLLDTDMAPSPDMLQMLLPPMLEHRDGAWRPDWRTGFTSSPQDFRNIESIWGADDPMNQANKFFWRILPTALDSIGLVHFWGTNVAFFVPALRDATGFVYGCMTEDTVTGAQLHRLGWSSSYVGDVSLTLAKGLCRENVTETFDQRKRWCQGNVQQLLMEWDPPLVLAESFRYPPYRRDFRGRLRDAKAQDRSGHAPARLSDEDVGAAARRGRRSWQWWFLRELAYFPTKHAIWFHLQPLYYYGITLAVLYMGQPPFTLDSHPVDGPLQFFSRFQVVLVYWLAGSLANFFGYSYILDEPNNPNSPLWRTQQEYWGYAWVRVIGILEGTLSAMTGRQPKWNAFGMSGGINYLYELPNAIAFVVMALSMGAVGVNYAVQARFGVGSELLPGPSSVPVPALVGSLMACGWVLVLMWPVTSCIFADFLRVPYYRLGAIVSTLFAATVQVGISIFFFAAQFAGR